MEKIIAKHPSVTVCTAPCGSGKTVFIKECVQRFTQLGLFKKALVIAPSDTLEDDYGFIPEKCHFIATTKKAISERLAQLIKRRQEDPRREPMLLILDDILGSVDFDSAPVVQIFTRYRHLKLTILVATQYPQRITPLIRDNTTYLVMFEQVSMIACRSLRENFCQEFYNGDQLMSFLKENCQDHHFIIVRRREPPKNKYARSKVQL